MLFEDPYEGRLQALVATHAREVVLLRDELEMQRDDQQRKRDGVSKDLIEVCRPLGELRNDGEALLERALEGAEELGVVEGVEPQQRDEGIAGIDVPHRMRTRGVGEARLEEIEDVEVARRADLIHPSPIIVMVECSDGREPGERLRQERTG